MGFLRDSLKEPDRSSRLPLRSMSLEGEEDEEGEDEKRRHEREDEGMKNDRTEDKEMEDEEEGSLHISSLNRSPTEPATADGDNDYNQDHHQQPPTSCYARCHYQRQRESRWRRWG